MSEYQSADFAVIRFAVDTMESAAKLFGVMQAHDYPVVSAIQESARSLLFTKLHALPDTSEMGQEPA